MFVNQPEEKVVGVFLPSVVSAGQTQQEANPSNCEGFHHTSLEELPTIHCKKQLLWICETNCICPRSVKVSSESSPEGGDVGALSKDTTFKCYNVSYICYGTSMINRFTG